MHFVSKPTARRFIVNCSMFIAVALALLSSAPARAVNAEKELTIRDLSVIEDPSRTLDPCDVGQEPLPAWSFGRIMQIVAAQAGAPDASAFVKDWLDTWTREQWVNG